MFDKDEFSHIEDPIERQRARIMSRISEIQMRYREAMEKELAPLIAMLGTLPPKPMTISALHVLMQNYPASKDRPEAKE